MENINKAVIINYPYQNLSLEDMGNEIWVDVKGFEGKYSISNMGRIKVINRQNRGFTEIMKQQLGVRNGRYLLIQLYKNNKPNTYSVHRLTAKHFIGNPLNLPEVNHIYGDKLDNRASELEWNTHQQNIRHAADILDVNGGVKHFRCKFTEKDVLDIYYANLPQRAIAEKYKVSHTVIGAIKRKVSYKTILSKVK